jgi:hypothetical protein
MQQMHEGPIGFFFGPSQNHRPDWLVGAPFTKFDAVGSRPAVLFCVLLYAKSTIANARHDSGVIFDVHTAAPGAFADA